MVFNAFAKIAKIPVGVVEYFAIAALDDIYVRKCEISKVADECYRQNDNSLVSYSQAPISDHIRQILEENLRPPNCPTMSCVVEKIKQNPQPQCQTGKPAFIAVADFMKDLACRPN